MGFRKLSLQEIIQIMEQTYGMPEQQPYEPPVDNLIRTILSQNTTDVNRDRAFSKLKKLGTWEQIARIDVSRIVDAIRLGGLANTKSVRIQKILLAIEQERGEIELDYLKQLAPDVVEKKLTEYPGVGLKTARCVQIFALDQQTFPVDTHIYRVAKRLCMIPEKSTRDDAHHILQNLVPHEKMYSFHKNMISHGKMQCLARGPKCDDCPFLKKCCWYRQHVLKKYRNSS